MMLIDFANMSGSAAAEYHDKQIEYNMTGLLAELKLMFPNDPNPDLSNPKYRDVVLKMPYVPLVAGGLAQSLGIKEEFMSLSLWKDLAAGYCPTKFLPEDSSLLNQVVDTPRGKLVKLNAIATPIDEKGEYRPDLAKKDRRMSTQFVFGLGTNTSNTITAMILENPEVELRLVESANRIFSKIIIPEMTADAMVRIGTDGENLGYVKELLAVGFMHTENRSAESFTHWHLEVMNTALGEDDKLYALRNDLICQNKDKYNALFQIEMKQFLEKDFGLSFKPIYLDEDLNNDFLMEHERNIASYDVEDKFVPESLRQELGARKKEMDALMKKLGVQGFIAEEIARRETRQEKTEMSPRELKAQWSGTYKKHGFSAQSFAQHQNFNQVKNPEVVLPTPAVLISNYLRKSKKIEFTEDQFKSHILKQLLNTCSTDTADRYAEEIFSSQCLQMIDKEQGKYFKSFLDDSLTDAQERKQKQIRFGRDVRFTTQSVLDMTKYNTESLLARQEETGFQLSKKEAIAAILAKESELSKPGNPFQFSMGQKNAMVAIMCEKGAVVLCPGRAGSGKSTLLDVVFKEYKKNGYRPIATSTSSVATKGLAKSTGLKQGEHFNLTELLIRLDKEKLKLTPKDIIVMDEAGMTDLENYYRVIKHVNKAGAKLILVGEAEQLQPVGLGQMFGVMSKQFTSVHVKDINRQREKWQREMVEDFASGNAHDSVTTLFEKGNVIITKTEDGRMAKLVKDYLDDKNPHSEKFIIASTNIDVEKLNDAVRKSLIAKKLIGADEVTLKGKDGIDRQFSVGDRLVFTKNQKSDNANQTKLSNSETGTVTSISRYLSGRAHSVQIKLDDGTQHFLSLAKDHSVKHGYASTVNRAQGGTRESVFYYVSKSLNSLHTAYVACSRHRDSLKIYLSEQMVETLAGKMEGKPPTTMMVTIAQATAKKKGLELPPDTLKSFMDTREFLTAHYEPKDPEKRRKASHVLDDFKNVISAMGQTQYKKTTYDYDLADGVARNAYQRERFERRVRVPGAGLRAPVQVLPLQSLKAPAPTKPVAWKAPPPQIIIARFNQAVIQPVIAQVQKVFKPKLHKQKSRTLGM